MSVTQHARTTFVTRAFSARAYPSGRHDGVWAPQRVGARVEPAHDEKREPAHDAIERKG
jgi:hypothetical protein